MTLLNWVKVYNAVCTPTPIHRLYTQTFSPPQKTNALPGIEPAAPPPSQSPSRDVNPLHQSHHPERQYLPFYAKVYMTFSPQPDYYTSKVTAIVSVTLTAADIQGTDLSEPSVLFWHRHREGAWNKLTTATLSWLSFIPSTLSHLVLLSRSLGNRWKEAQGFWVGLLSRLVTYILAYCVVLDRTSTDSHSSHTIVNV